MAINTVWVDDLECASSVVNVPKSLRKKFAGKKINFRRYYKCKGFFNHKCHMVRVEGEVKTIEEMEEWTSARWTYDGEKCYYFESDEDASWFVLTHGIPANT